MLRNPSPLTINKLSSPPSSQSGQPITAGKPVKSVFAASRERSRHSVRVSGRRISPPLKVSTASCSEISSRDKQRPAHIPDPVAETICEIPERSTGKPTHAASTSTAAAAQILARIRIAALIMALQFTRERHLKERLKWAKLGRCTEFHD